MKQYNPQDRSRPGDSVRAGRLFACLTGALALAGAAAGVAHATTAPGRLIHPEKVVLSKKAASQVTQPSQWRVVHTTIQHPKPNMATLIAQAAANQTIPFWTSQVTSPVDGNTYTTSMVGSSPFSPANTKTPTVISFLPILLRVHFEDGTVLDPTKPSCGDTVPMATRFLNSPLFQPNNIYSNGVHVGGGGVNSQLESAFQRANYWSLVKGTNYGIQLKPGRATPIIVDIFAPDGNSETFPGIPAVCGNKIGAVTIGAIDINAYDALIENILYQYSGPTQLPVFLSYNLVQTIQGGCCVLGYHSAFGDIHGTQTYASGGYIDSGIFGGVDDIVDWSHELGEWLDDPFVQANVAGGNNDDITPAWGGTGQVPQGSCQNNLEVGDPLTGTEFAIPGVGGFTYHMQDLTFHDWFFRTKSTSTGGQYSFWGTFNANAGPVCQVAPGGSDGGEGLLPMK